MILGQSVPIATASKYAETARSQIPIIQAGGKIGGNEDSSTVAALAVRNHKDVASSPTGPRGSSLRTSGLRDVTTGLAEDLRSHYSERQIRSKNP